MGTTVNTTIRIDAVLSLITYVIGLTVFICIYQYVDVLYSVAFLALFSVSVYLEYRRRYFIPRWLLIVVSIAIVAFSLYRLDLNQLITQMLEALLLLLAIKFLEEKRFRDYMQIYAIALLLLSGLGLLSLSISFLVYFLVLILLLTIAIVLLTFHAQDPALRFSKKIIARIIWKTALIPFFAIPLAAVMFIILPRSQYPLLDFLNRPDKAKTGFTDTVRLGTVSDIQEDSSIVIRANMERISDDDLYWRGITFDYFDGRSWKSTHKGTVPSQNRTFSKGKVVTQTIYLEPYDNPYIFALDRPISILLRDMVKGDDFTFSMRRPIDRRLKYNAVSILSPGISEQGLDRGRYLQLPQDISPQIKRLVAGLISGRNRTDSINAIYRFLHDGEYSYSLKNLPITENPVEDFLLKEKYGNCEYFASAFAVMLRLAGIPSRVVGGYRGGYFNEIGRYYLVPQKNAHVWVEAYTDENVWVRLDPTPGSGDNYVFAGTGTTFRRLRIFFDTINYYWNALIINYNFEKQFALALKIRYAIRRPSFSLHLDKGSWIAFTGLPIIAIGVLFGSYLLLVRRKRREQRMLALFLKKMEKQGYKKRVSEGLEEFISSIPDPEIRKKADPFVKEFDRLYFTDHRFDRDDVKRLRSLIRML